VKKDITFLAVVFISRAVISVKYY